MNKRKENIDMLLRVEDNVMNSAETANSLIIQAIEILDKLGSDSAQVAAAYLSIALD